MTDNLSVVIEHNANIFKAFVEIEADKMKLLQVENQTVVNLLQLAKDGHLADPNKERIFIQYHSPSGIKETLRLFPYRFLPYCISSSERHMQSYQNKIQKIFEDTIQTYAEHLRLLR